MVAAGWVSHGLETLESQRAGLVVGAQAALLHDHFYFALEFLCRQFESRQAIGFQFEGHCQAVARQYLVVGGVIVAGECVFFGAQFAQDARGLARAKLAAALEHHVFEGVGQAGLSGRLIAGADLVPELGDHYRRPVIFSDDHLEAVIQKELVGGLGFGSHDQR